MVHLAFKYVAVVASSLLIFAVAQAENRAEKRSARQDKKAEHIDHTHTVAAPDGTVPDPDKAVVEGMKSRMNRNAHGTKYDPKAVQKSALKK